MSDETTDIQDMSDQERKQIAESGSGGGNMLMNRQAFAQAYQVARLFSSSQLVPQHLQGKPHDCFIALHMADRLGEDPLMVMQNIVIVHGTAGWKAQWLIGRANRSGVFRGRIKFDTSGSGDDLEVTARATMADTGEEVTASASMKMAKAEGWTSNKKYQSMPQQMLSYRAASFLIRLYCPEATLGYQSAEEVEDMAASGQMRDVTPGRYTPTNPGGGGGAEAALRGLGGQDAPDPGPVPGETAESAPTRTEAGGEANASENGSQTASQGEAKRDRYGTPWDARIHAQAGTTNKDGSWRRRRGVDDAEYATVMREIDPDNAPQEPEQSDEAGDSGETGDGPGDNEIVQRIQRTLPQARENGDMDTLDDLEAEASEIRDDGWREQCRRQIQEARAAVADAG